jgi:RNA polymerase sigma-32 factor
MSTALAIRTDNIDHYIAEISKYPLLTREQEVELAERFQYQGDIAAAHRLVVSNLRFVVKIAHQYRGYGFKLLDLIQEGNIGLMMAVKKFDPAKGYRLISYAVWWIRAQIRSFVVRSWSLVKIGTTYAQRKLFFSLRGARARHEQGQEEAGDPSMTSVLAEELGVEAPEVADMEMRLAARDFSLDAKLSDESPLAHIDMVADAGRSQEDELVEREQQHLLRGKVASAMDKLSDKERCIVEQRFMTDEPKTLQEIGDAFHLSRERVRQIEARLIKKLRVSMNEANAETVPPPA